MENFSSMTVKNHREEHSVSLAPRAGKARRCYFRKRLICTARRHGREIRIYGRDIRYEFSTCRKNNEISVSKR